MKVLILSFLIELLLQVWETPFDSTNSSFPCSVNRIKGPLSTTDHMSLINHFLDLDEASILIPDEAVADTTNSVDSILADAYGCVPLNGGRAPNFVLMDWVNSGNASGAIALLNGVQDTQVNSAGPGQFIHVFSILLFLWTTCCLL